MTQFTEDEYETAYRVLFNFPKDISIDYVMRWINEHTKQELDLDKVFHSEKPTKFVRILKPETVYHCPVCKVGGMRFQNELDTSFSYYCSHPDHMNYVYVLKEVKWVEGKGYFPLARDGGENYHKGFVYPLTEDLYGRELQREFKYIEVTS